MTVETLADIFIAPEHDYTDHRLKALVKAKELWLVSTLADRHERLAMAFELHAFQMFSLNQIAKVCRLNVGTVARHMKKNATGGRFAPEGLASLIYIRKLVITHEQIPSAIVRTAVSSGTSVSTVARLTGASQTTLYARA